MARKYKFRTYYSVIFYSTKDNEWVSRDRITIKEARWLARILRRSMQATDIRVVKLLSSWNEKEGELPIEV